MKPVITETTRANSPIVFRGSGPEDQQDWFFSYSGGNFLELTGYRRYAKVCGEWQTVERWYPDLGSLAAGIQPEDIPFPPDVMTEAASKSFARMGQVTASLGVEITRSAAGQAQISVKPDNIFTANTGEMK